MPARARRSPRVVAGLGLLLSLLLAVLLVGTVLDLLLLVAAVGIGVPVVATLLRRDLVRAAPQHTGLVRAQAQLPVLLGQLLVLAFLLRRHAVSRPVEAWLVGAVAATEMLRALAVVLQEVDDRLRRPRAELRNLPGPGGPLPVRPAVLGEPGALVLAGVAVLLPLALLAATATGSYALVLPAAVAGALVTAVGVAASAGAVLALARLPRGGALLRGVHAAVLEHAPRVVLYSNGSPEDTHWVTAWLPTLERLGRPALVMLRKHGTIDRLPPSSVPVVCLPEGGDVLPFELPSAPVAVFVANSQENLRLLRNPSLRTAFLGHGDSDKAASANPVVQMYDEVWVAGEAGRRRYLDAGVGVRPEQLRVVGRPQVQGVLPATARPAGSPYTVLYAPTWEGAYGDPYESSLVHSGREIVRRLLRAEGVRVVFRPHPATGRRSAAHAAALRDVAALVGAAGGGHAVSPGPVPDLYTCFNDADLLVADVSAVVSDFLAADKPYAVVNGAGLPEQEFRSANPSCAAAYLLGPGGAGLAAVLSDARGPDSLRERRRHVRRLLLGPPSADPVAVFASALDALAAAPGRGRLSAVDRPGVEQHLSGT